MFWELLTSKKGKVVLKNYLSLLLIQGANFLLPLILLQYLVRVLGIHNYGLVMIAQAVALYFGVFVDYGFSVSGTRAVAVLRDSPKALASLFSNIITAKLFLLLISFCILCVVVIAVPRFRMESTVYLSSFLVVIGQSIFPTWFFQGIEKMQVLSIVNVAAKIVFTIAVFIVVQSPDDYLWVPICHGAGFIFSGIIGLGYSLKYVGFVKPKYTEIKKILMETTPLFLSNMAVTCYTASNTLILGLIGGEAIAGVYASLEKLVLAIKNLYVPLYQALFPWLAPQKRAESRLFITKMILPIGGVGALVTALFIVMGSYILRVVYDDAIISSNVNVLKIVSLIAFLAALNMLFISLYFPSIKAYVLKMRIQVAVGIFNIVVVIFATQFYGIYGTACTAVVSEFLLLLLAYVCFYKKVEL